MSKVNGMGVRIHQVQVAGRTLMATNSSEAAGDIPYDAKQRDIFTSLH